MSKLTRVEYFGTRVPIIHPPNLVFFFGLPTRCALPDNIDRYAVNRPSPAEADEKVYVRLEEVQHAIPGTGYENIWNFSILQLQPLQILIWEFDGTGLEKRACEAASQSDTWCTEGPRVVWTRLGSRPAKIRPRDLAGVLPEH